MTQEWYEQPFVFPKWANYLLPAIVMGVVGGLFYVPTVVGLGASPKTTAVGYSPVQPVPYSHALHAGKLGIDCRYCHTTVERANFASIPPTETCMNCHTNIRSQSDKLEPIRGRGCYFAGHAAIDDLDLNAGEYFLEDLFELRGIAMAP